MGMGGAAATRDVPKVLSVAGAADGEQGIEGQGVEGEGVGMYLS